MFPNTFSTFNRIPLTIRGRALHETDFGNQIVPCLGRCVGLSFGRQKSTKKPWENYTVPYETGIFTRKPVIYSKNFNILS